ncbi:MAG: hypothetical protein FWF99_03320, partial [Desulfovibrionaceae bacterium]|nr:hypothetical protein [Desulfovibrionaceae bacterium]
PLLRHQAFQQSPLKFTKTSAGFDFQRLLVQASSSKFVDNRDKFGVSFRGMRAHEVSKETSCALRGKNHAGRVMVMGC